MEVTVKSTVSRTVAVDNSADVNRECEISAQVTVNDDGIIAVNSGMLTDSEGHRVTFSAYGGLGNMRIEFNGATEWQDVIATIDAFLAGVKAKTSVTTND